jgi:hypothetical protein
MAATPLSRAPFYGRDVSDQIGHEVLKKAFKCSHVARNEWGLS